MPQEVFRLNRWFGLSSVEELHSAAVWKSRDVIAFVPENPIKPNMLVVASTTPVEDLEKKEQLVALWCGAQTCAKTLLRDKRGKAFNINCPIGAEAGQKADALYVLLIPRGAADDGENDSVKGDEVFAKIDAHIPKVDVAASRLLRQQLRL